jgi:hypothetical protein
VHRRQESTLDPGCELEVAFESALLAFRQVVKAEPNERISDQPVSFNWFMRSAAEAE